MELHLVDLFKNTDEIKNHWVQKHSRHTLKLTEEWRELSSVFEKIKLRAHKIDSTLAPSAEAVQARLKTCF